MMKPLALAIALASLGAVCVQPSHAQTYTPYTVLSSPTNGSTYYIQIDEEGGTITYPTVPVSTTQYVQVTGAPPNQGIGLSWDLYVVAYNSGTIPLTSDVTNGTVTEQTNGDGMYTHYIDYLPYPGNYKTSFVATKAGGSRSNGVEASSTINGQSLANTVYFSVIVTYII